MQNKVAIVTGSSRGIGAEIAITLASKGVNVLINYLSNEKSALEIADKCKAFGVEAHVFGGDVSKFDVAKKLVEFTIEKFGKIDILVNNAGKTADTLVMRMSESQFDDVICANLKSAFNMTKHVSSIMMKARTGSIINITSVAGVSGNAGQANYSASKAGMIGLTLSNAKEFGARGVRVNAIAPGFIETDMTADLPGKVLEYAKTGTSLKRMGTAKEVAALVSFLASDNSSYITGQVIKIDGGLVL